MSQSDEFDIKPLIEAYLNEVNQEIKYLNRIAILATLGLATIATVAVNVVL